MYIISDVFHGIWPCIIAYNNKLVNRIVKKILVSWAYYSQYMKKMFQTTNQIAIAIVNVFRIYDPAVAPRHMLPTRVCGPLGAPGRPAEFT